MERCATCGNDYDRMFTVTMSGETHAFDSFECAMEKLAPRCASCGCRVLGHGVEHERTVYCCGHCARRAGVEEAHSRV